MKRAKQWGFSPLVSRIIANRLDANHLDHTQVEFAALVQPKLSFIAAPNQLADCIKAATRIIDAIAQNEHIGILTDYDVDGMTSHVILFEALCHFFHLAPAKLSSHIGHRIQDGYGISDRLTDRILALDDPPSLIITADCGSSDELRIARLKQAGIDVIVTDHHALPEQQPPISAYATLNPTRSDCDYPDSTIAGCMVAWLLVCQVRNLLIERGQLASDAPKLTSLLAFVALGTVADCVSLAQGPINRAVIQAGLALINHTQRPCWLAMHQLLALKEPFTAETLGFQMGPRINARSRMADPYAALHFLMASKLDEATHYLSLLDKDNQDRKRTEQEMVQCAMVLAEAQVVEGKLALVIYLEEGHAGVQGIVASRMVDRFGRPTIVLCPSNDVRELVGSARTIPTVHILEALRQVAAQYSDIFVKFGGHQGAAGMTLYKSQLETFNAALNIAVQQQLSSDVLRPFIETDGVLATEQLSMQTLEDIDQLQPFGRGFEIPCFETVFLIQAMRPVGKDGTHLSCTLRSPQGSGDMKGIWFNAIKSSQPVPFSVGDSVVAVYTLQRNHFRGETSLQLLIRHLVFHP
ncbi:MAG: single-stranded-DNA-specific exonuclease RecJ [Mariprofundaceae bacterium]